MTVCPIHSIGSEINNQQNVACFFRSTGVSGLKDDHPRVDHPIDVPRPSNHHFVLQYPQFFKLDLFQGPRDDHFLRGRQRRVENGRRRSRLRLAGRRNFRRPRRRAGSAGTGGSVRKASKRRTARCGTRRSRRATFASAGGLNIPPGEYELGVPSSYCPFSPCKGHLESQSLLLTLKTWLVNTLDNGWSWACFKGSWRLQAVAQWRPLFFHFPVQEGQKSNILQSVQFPMQQCSSSNEPQVTEYAKLLWRSDHASYVVCHSNSVGKKTVNMRCVR